MKIRAPTVHGIFYPADPETLRELAARLLAGTGSPPAWARSIISPHAAYSVSGEVAGAAFQAAADRKPERILIIGPVHREPAEKIFLPEAEAFQTPLGLCPVDLPFLKELARFDPRFRFDEIPHLEEHCLEVQLPFVQTLFPGTPIVPVLMGRNSPALARLLADALRRSLAPGPRGALIVVSVNMTRLRPAEQGRRELEAALAPIASLDAEAFLEAAARRLISTCGVACIAAILFLERLWGGKAVALKRGDSLAAGADRLKAVHYAAVAFESVDHGTNPVIGRASDPAAGSPGGD